MPTLLLVFAATTFVPWESAADHEGNSPRPARDPLIEVTAGNLPLILLAPHGGRELPAGMPPLVDALGSDYATDRLAVAVARELTFVDERGVTRRPHLVVNRLHRKLVEPNQSWERNLRRGWQTAAGVTHRPHSRAAIAHRDFHAAVANAVSRVQAQFGRGLLIDLHGLAASRRADMYGYLLRGNQFHAQDAPRIPATDQDLADALRTGSSMQVAASRKRTDAEVAGLVRGPAALASLVDTAYPGGRTAVPSLRHPNPKAPDAADSDQTYFNGAYNLAAHSSRQPGIRVDAIQVETTADARNNAALRERFAQAFAKALRQFVRTHYELSIEPTTRPQ